MRVFYFLLLLISIAFSAEIRAYYNPGCGCCESYFSKLERMGYRIKRIPVDSSKLDSIKDSLVVPLEMRSCHTMEYQGRFIEGHVHPKGIERLIKDEKVKGVAAPHGLKSARGGFESRYFVVNRDNRIKEVKP